MVFFKNTLLYIHEGDVPAPRFEFLLDLNIRIYKVQKLCFPFIIPGSNSYIQRESIG